MDIVAKKAKPDKDGVRIAELDEDSYCLKLWQHRPLTDFWQIGMGTARTLQAHGMNTMGDIAAITKFGLCLEYALFMRKIDPYSFYHVNRWLCKMFGFAISSLES